MSARIVGRRVLCALSLRTAPLAATAQQGGGPGTAGSLGHSSPSLEAARVDAFRQGLRPLGYVEGQHLGIRYRWAEGQPERYARLARELVRLQPDVTLTAGTPGTLAAKHTTPSIPLVTALAGEPGAAGLVSRLAPPGGNVTGRSTLAPGLGGKRLELFTPAVPRLSRVGALLTPANPCTTIAWQAMPPAAEALGVQLQPVGARGPHDRARATIKAARPDGLIVVPDHFLLT
jgi:putative tryptophan/tyrosine transport system substrate-binding protein